ncbi:integrase catalytic domain-containing protein [Trichonephila clavipes]|nr:integrase catalytic domain-containing protein [Trichonephila clavipes]
MDVPERLFGVATVNASTAGSVVKEFKCNFVNDPVSVAMDPLLRPSEIRQRKSRVRMEHKRRFNSIVEFMFYVSQKLPLSDNINEYEVLTPGHFIIGRPISAIPEPAILDISDNRLSRWQYTTKCVQTIWKRWKNDYLNHLQQRNKWQFEKNNVAVGCLGLLKENDLPPCKWTMARILEVIYGTDGKVRVVKLKTATEFSHVLSQKYVSYQ